MTPSFVFVSVFASIALGQNNWIYPKPGTNPTFHENDILVTSWVSGYTSPYLTLLCSNFNGVPQIKKSVPPTGSYTTILNYCSSTECACHFNLAEAAPQGGSLSLDSPNFNIDPNAEISPTTWNSDSDSGPTTTTVSGSTSVPAMTTATSAVISTVISTAVVTTASAAANTVTKTLSSLPTSPASLSPDTSNQAGKHPTPGGIVGASIGAVVGVAALIGIAIICVRSGWSKRRGIPRSSDSGYPTQHNHWPHQNLMASTTTTEVDGGSAAQELSGGGAAQESFGQAVSELNARR